MPSPKTILIAGSSGMVGSHLLQICLDSNEVNKIILLSRKPSLIKDSKIEEIIVEDFINFTAPHFKQIDVVFFCIGIYTGAADKNTFKKITVDYPVALAKAVYAHSPSSKFILLSGARADRSEKSWVTFEKLKGMAENKLYEIYSNNFHSARPSYIYPVIKRKEPNLMYKFSRFFYPLIKLLGEKFSITSIQVAKALFVLGMKQHEQTSFENKELIVLNRKNSL